ncbi:MAG: phenol hydroxylase subunit P4 [Burkholderiales bacterium]|nr:phenol hydroxylase subunit P4 [Burkholderiales bacterium]
MAAVAAVKPYAFPPADSLDKFHGNQLVYIGWDQHLMFCAPFCFPLPPGMPFGAFVEQVLPTCFGYHPEFKQIDWSRAQWLKSGQPFVPDFTKSLADNGIGHKDALRLRTPGLNGIKGSAT